MTPTTPPRPGVPPEIAAALAPTVVTLTFRKVRATMVEGRDELFALLVAEPAAAWVSDPMPHDLALRIQQGYYQARDAYLRVRCNRGEISAEQVRAMRQRSLVRVEDSVGVRMAVAPSGMTSYAFKRAMARGGAPALPGYVLAPHAQAAA